MAAHPLPDLPESDVHDAKIIPFRRAAHPESEVAPAEPVGQAVEGLEKFESEPDDYRQRMLVNVIAGAFVVALGAAGIWLVLALATLNKSQECVLAGRPNCAHISIDGHTRR